MQFSPPAPPRPWRFPRGARRPPRREPGNRASLVSVRPSRRGTTTPATRALLSRTAFDANARQNSELAAGSERNPVGYIVLAMLVALLLAAALALAGPAAARRHAPDLREDEPARRTTRPAGEYSLLAQRTALQAPAAPASLANISARAAVKSASISPSVPRPLDASDTCHVPRKPHSM